MLCLTLEIAGRTIRLAQRHTDISVDGRTRHYHAGLPTVDLGDQLSLLEIGVAPEVQMDALLPVDVAALVEQGHQLDGATAEVAIYSGDWSQREIVAAGYVRDPECRPGIGLVHITVSSDPGDDSALWPPADATLETGNTWNAIDPAMEGRSYPWIIGRPGVYQAGGVSNNISGSPAYVLDTAAGAVEAVLLAGHDCAGTLWTPAAGGTARVRLRDHTAGVEDDLDVSVSAGAITRTADLLGRDCYVGQMSAAAGQAPIVHAAWAPGHVMTAQWTGAGGVWDRRRTGPVERAGDVLRWTLELSSLPIDWRRMESAAHLLRDYVLAGYWDERCSPWSWARDQILPLLPVSLLYSSLGLYPVVWRWWAGRESAVRHLEIGRNCRYLSGPTVEGSSDRITTATVRGAFTCVDGGTSRIHTTIQPDQPAGRWQASSLYTRRATLELTGAPSYELDGETTWDRLTPALAARRQIAQWAAAAPTVTVRVPSSLGLALGDVVTLTWPALSMTRRPALITGRLRRGEAADLTLRPTAGRVYR